jgi:hypothetical protein
MTAADQHGLVHISEPLCEEMARLALLAPEPYASALRRLGERHSDDGGTEEPV